MKKTILILTIMVVCNLFMGYAQQPQNSTATQSTSAESANVEGDGVARLAAIISTPRSEWLGTFDKINIVGHMQVTLIRISEQEGTKIYFDTKGSTTTKFKTEIDKKGVLNVIETVDSKRTTVTEVKIYHHDLSSLSIAGANVTMEQPFTQKMFDLSVSGGATLRAEVDVLDMNVMVTGCSSVILDGAVRYLGLKVSTAKFDASSLQTMATIVDASHGAEVSLFVTERLEATTSTSAKILYKGHPSLVRAHTSLFGGEIISTDK